MAQDGAFDDSDPTAYSQYVLYVRAAGTNDNCDAVTSRIDNLPIGAHVLEQDVMKLATRPAWLRGVPTLLVKSDNSVHTGVRDIMAFASAWRDPELQSMTTGRSASVGGASLFDSGMFSIDGDPTPTSVPTLPGNGAARGERAQRKAEMAADANNAVERMQNARASQDRRIQANNGQTPPARNMMSDEMATQLPVQRRVSGW